jgi:NADH-quinone oxidoreductase subunit J
MLEITPALIAFFIFALLSIGGALGVVANRNLIHGALFLIISLFGAAGLFVLLLAPFLAAVQVLVYIGAIVVLIIFAAMLTRGMTQTREIFNRQWWLAGLLAVVLLALLSIGILLPVWGPNGTNTPDMLSAMTVGVSELGVALVDGNQYVLPFEVASLLLTAAMIFVDVFAGGRRDVYHRRVRRTGPAHRHRHSDERRTDAQRLDHQPGRILALPHARQYQRAGVRRVRVRRGRGRSVGGFGHHSRRLSQPQVGGGGRCQPAQRLSSSAQESRKCGGRAAHF